MHFYESPSGLCDAYSLFYLVKEVILRHVMSMQIRYLIVRLIASSSEAILYCQASEYNTD